MKKKDLGITARELEIQFTEHIEIHAPALNGFIAKRVRCEADIEGRVQETLIAAWQAYPNFKGDSKIKSWLFAIAKNKIAEYYRQPNQKVITVEYDENDREQQASNDNECYRQLVEADNKCALHKCIALLPKHYQKVIYWHEFEGLNHTEIAQRLGKSVSATRTQLSRARNALRKHVQRFQAKDNVLICRKNSRNIQKK